MTVYVSREHKTVLVPVRQDLVNVFPEAKRLGDHLAIPHGISETALLQRLGLPVPSPILVQYDWAGGTPFAIQKRTAALLTVSRGAYVLNGLGCVDADTEYLSENGWVRIADYPGGKVAQYHPGSGEIEFVTPTEFVKLPCAEMIRFKTTRGVDQLLSPEHRVLLDNGLVVSAENVEQVYPNPRTRRLLKFRTTFMVKGTPGIALTDAQIRLQVAVNADGHMRHAQRVDVRLKKPRKIMRIRTLLTQAGVEYKEGPCPPHGFVRFSFCPPMQKGFCPAWWAATQAQLRVVADELVHWDGSARKAGGRGFYSSSKTDADFAQYAYSASGCRASLVCNGRGEYTVYAARGRTTAGLYGRNGAGNVRRNVWREPSTDGFKYCFMVPSTFLLLRRNGCVFATGNTGKTRCALWSWDFLYSKGWAGKLLVVAPLSTLEFTWAAEVFSTIPHRKTVVLGSPKGMSKKKRLERLADKDADIYIINHDGAKLLENELAARQDITCIVLDELAMYRHNSDRTKSMRRLARSKQWIWGMTGAPTPGGSTDAYYQCTVITPHTVPKRFNQFQSMVARQVGPHTWEEKEDAVKIVHGAMQPAVRFSLDDVTELPPIIERDVDAPLSDRQKIAYQRLAREFAVLIDQKQVTAVNAGVLMGKLLQVSGGWVYAGSDTIDLEPQPRVDQLLDILAECERKVLVFCPYRHTCHGISRVLAAKELSHAVVHGDVGDRSEIFNHFQNTTKYKILVAHPACMAHGLTLTAADTIIWYSPITSLEIYEQANARIRRVGQKHKQLIFHMVATPVERKIYRMLRKRQKVQDQLLDLFAEATALKV